MLSQHRSKLMRDVGLMLFRILVAAVSVQNVDLRNKNQLP
jgi:hypothetical protein